MGLIKKDQVEVVRNEGGSQLVPLMERGRSLAGDLYDRNRGSVGEILPQTPLDPLRVSIDAKTCGKYLVDLNRKGQAHIRAMGAVVGAIGQDVNGLMRFRRPLSVALTDEYNLWLGVYVLLGISPFGPYKNLFALIQELGPYSLSRAYLVGAQNALDAIEPVHGEYERLKRLSRSAGALHDSAQQRLGGISDDISKSISKMDRNEPGELAKVLVGESGKSRDIGAQTRDTQEFMAKSRAYTDAQTSLLAAQASALSGIPAGVATAAAYSAQLSDQSVAETVIHGLWGHIFANLGIGWWTIGELNRTLTRAFQELYLRNFMNVLGDGISTTEREMEQIYRQLIAGEDPRNIIDVRYRLK